VKKLTSVNEQTGAWATSALEVVLWKSQDGTRVEGVLHKRSIRSVTQVSAPGRHPRRPDRRLAAVPFTSATYPIDVWGARGVLVLDPNYRGSAGYGEAFSIAQRQEPWRRRRLGRASGIDALIAKGFVDPQKVWRDGMEPGRLHLGVPRDARRCAASKPFPSGAGNLRLDDV